MGARATAGTDQRALGAQWATTACARLGLRASLIGWYRARVKAGYTVVSRADRRVPLAPWNSRVAHRWIGSVSTPCFEPRERTFLLVKAEMLHFRVDEVSDYAWHDRQKLTIGHCGNALYLALVLPDELQVRKKPFEVLPAGERLRIDHQASKLPVCHNEWINFLPDELEIRFLERALGCDDKDPPVTQQFEMDHWSFPFG